MRPDRLMLSKRRVLADQGQRHPGSLLITQFTTRALLSNPTEAAPPSAAVRWRHLQRRGSVAGQRRRS